jgi:hypothetical protein
MRNFLLIFLFTSTITIKLNAQEIDKRIVEVYGNHLEHILKNDPERLIKLNDLLENRVSIITSQKSGNDKYPKLSSVALLNKYNPDLIRDDVFDASTFNVLKYDLNFFTNTSSIYRIDNTDFLIVIKAQ